MRILLICLSTLVSLFSLAQPTRILFILDASGSMNARWEDGTRWEIATKILSNTLDSLEKTTAPPEVALRVYGHQHSFPPQVCNDTKLEVAFHTTSYRHIRNKLKSLRAKGTTPIAYSLEQAANDFPTEAGRNIIILLTDGKEECDGDPCKISQMIQEKGISIRPYIIGMGMENDDMNALNCIGKTFNTSTPQEFQQQLHAVIRYSLLPSSAQVDLLDLRGKNTETNVGVTISEQFTGKPMYHFVHTLNRKGNPDTIYIDPAPLYRLTVHTTPPVIRENIELAPGKHTHISASIPRGILQINMPSAQAYKDLKTVVRQNGKTINLVDIPGNHSYLAGMYELEILSLPPMKLNVEVKADEKVEIKLPGPGTVLFQANAAFYGHIVMEVNGKWENIYTFPANSTTRFSLGMQPGNYRLIYRPVAAKSMYFNKEIPFEVNTGGSTLVKIP